MEVNFIRYYECYPLKGQSDLLLFKIIGKLQ